MTTYSPVTLTYLDGTTLAFSREGRVVTVLATPGTNPSLGGPAKLLPPQFTPAGNSYMFQFSSGGAADPHLWFFLLDEINLSGNTPGSIGVSLSIMDGGPWQPFTAQWLADPDPSTPGDNTPRIWLYNKLTSTPGLVDLIGGLANPRVFAKKTMSSAIEEHPYIVYKLGYSATEDLSEESTEARQFVQIFVHDTANAGGDYMKIDQIIDELRKALRLQGSPYHGVITCRYLETSQDLNDETLDTVFKYARFQLITKEK